MTKQPGDTQAGPGQGFHPEQIMARDEPGCVRLVDEIGARTKRGKSVDRLAQQLSERLKSSMDEVARREALVPSIELPPELPISDHADEIVAALGDHQVLVVAGETGSGKTTQLPKLCLRAGRGRRGRIGHTQPRRIAARTVCRRIAEELGDSAGQRVAYQVRFKDYSGDDTLVKLMTDGILLAEVQHDPLLRQYDTLIIDEAHERSLNIDFLLGYLKQLLARRPELKLIITSATIDVESLSRHFDGAPVIEVSGRTYPVEVQYLPPDSMPADAASSLPTQLLYALGHIESEEAAGRGHRNGDVLVFLPGERDIREAALALRRSEYQQLDVLPLYARLGSTEQDRVFNLAKRRGRRIVLATNVAETSLTVPGIRYVIDAGVARISRYSHRSRVQRLPIEAVSQASAEQRKGRCGRTAPGICVRLYDEQDFLTRQEFTDPEILRTNLASVILQMTRMGLGEVAQFPFIAPPDDRLINDGYRLLEELGALDSRDKLSDCGRQLARLPVDPRIARMLHEAAKRGCLSEMLVIAAGLSIQDPRERPLDKQQAADQQHARFRDDRSDFVSLLNLWQYFEQQRQALSKSQLGKQCQREFLSARRLFEWRDLHHQLRLAARDLKWRENAEQADYVSLHRALLAGQASHVGQRDERRDYLGTRNRKFQLFPGSGLTKKPPPWLLAAELVDTGRLYGRMAALVEPEWIIDAAAHLLKRSYSEPHWSAKRKSVVAFEKTSLYGLVLRDKKRVNYGPIDPLVARQVFIRQALVEQSYKSSAALWQHNSALRAELLEIEVKQRRHDLLIDDDELYRFYDQRIPTGIVNGAGFERWLKKDPASAPKLERADLLRRDPAAGSEQSYPDSLVFDDFELALHYHFSPGKAGDGVRADIPVALINRLPLSRFDWLVPGMLQEKCVELVKSLPKRLRKSFVPAPDFVARAMPALRVCDKPLIEALGEALAPLGGVRIPLDAWNPAALDPYYQMYFRILDGDDNVLGEGRDISALVERFRPQLRAEIGKATESNDDQRYRSWQFGALPADRVVDHGSVSVRVFPALVDQGDSVSVAYLDQQWQAEREQIRGLARLAMLSLAEPRKYIRKELLKSVKGRLELTSLVPAEELAEDFLQGVFAEVFVRGQPRPQDEAGFEQLIASRRGELVATASRYQGLLADIITLNHQLKGALARLDLRVWGYAADDMQAQLTGLLHPHFLLSEPLSVLAEYPRYLKGIAWRLDKLQGHEQKDRKATDEVALRSERLQLWLDKQPCASQAATDYRWLLEEYRLSLFAQGIGTRQAVSAKRLDKLWLDVSADSGIKR